jgi:hypothetical protein
VSLYPEIGSAWPKVRVRCSSPNPYKLDVNVDTEGFLELV